jgi:hypothetical protein
MKKLNLVVWLPVVVMIVCGALAYRVWRMLPNSATVAATTPIPGSGYEVRLLGPDIKGHYWYHVVQQSAGQTVARRFIGPGYFKRAPSDRPENALVPSVAREESDGVWRITWGKEHADPAKSTYAVIDVKNRVVVRDINGANRANEPFANLEELKAASETAEKR